MEQKLIIIGGGAAGLAAGCYARMNGYHTTILEMSKTPGGLCTSWKRGGYLFDGSVAGLAGTSPGNALFQVWEELGIIKYCPLYYGENFGHVLLPDGRKITIYTDIHRLTAHLIDHFPDDMESINELRTALISVLDLDIPFTDAKGMKAMGYYLSTIITTLSNLPVLFKYGTMSIRQFSNQFKDPSLTKVFQSIVHFGGQDVPMLTLLLPLAYAHRRMAGIPQKGWLSFARALERRFLELGGEIQYEKKVERLVTKEKLVKGVILSDGTVHAADRVLSAADGRFSHLNLLKTDIDKIAKMFQPDEISDQPVQVNLGVFEDFSAEDGSVTYILDHQTDAAGKLHDRITVHNKHYDSDAAPQGKSALTVFLDSDYFWWKEIAADRARYEREKTRCADMVMEIMERFHPNLRDKVEVADISTPLTREHFTGNWMGAMQAKKPNSRMIKAMLQNKPQYSCKEVKGFYMAGQWVEPWGGITTAVQSGRKAMKAMCNDDKKRFETFKT